MAGIILPPTFAAGYASSAASSAYPQLWDGLIGAWVPQMGHQGITTLIDFSPHRLDGTLGGAMNNADWVVGRRGMALDFDGSNDNVIIPLRVAELLGGATACTLSCLIKRNSATANRGGIVGIPITGTSGKVILEIVVTTNAIRCGGRADAADAIQTVDTNDAFASTSVPYHITGVINLLDDSIQIWVNGVQQAVTGTPSWGQTTFDADVGTDCRLMSTAADASYTPALLHYVYIHAHALQPGEILALHTGASPLALRRISSGITLEDTSAITLTPDVAVFTLTALDATLTLGTVLLTHASAIVTFTAVDATLTLGTVALTTSPAVVTWTGQDATLTLGTVALTSSPAVVTWTALDAALTISGNINLSPAVAIVTWTGVDATFTLGAVALSPSPAIVTWTAADAALVIALPQTLSPSAAVVRWMALRPSLSLGAEEHALRKCCDDSTFGYSVTP